MIIFFFFQILLVVNLKLLFNYQQNYKYKNKYNLKKQKQFIKFS